eukprot:scaffold867_cov317-Pavlova_lutheri.AAC.33
MATAAMSAATARGNMRTARKANVEKRVLRVASIGRKTGGGVRNHVGMTRKQHVVRSVDFDVRHERR